MIENVIVKLEETLFRCECGCNVFHYPNFEKQPTILECNACRQWYQGIKKDKGSQLDWENIDD